MRRSSRGHAARPVLADRSGGQDRVAVALLVLFLLPLLLMPLAAVFTFAFKGGWPAFVAGALPSPDAQFALRFSVVIAAITTALNAVLGTFTAYVLAKYRFPGNRILAIIVNLPVAIPTVVVGHVPPPPLGTDRTARQARSSRSGSSRCSRRRACSSRTSS